MATGMMGTCARMARKDRPSWAGWGLPPAPIVPSGNTTSASPRSRRRRDSSIASRSNRPRWTETTRNGRISGPRIGLVSNSAAAKNVHRRGTAAAITTGSMSLLWLGARRTGPVGGIFRSLTTASPKPSLRIARNIHRSAAYPMCFSRNSCTLAPSRRHSRGESGRRHHEGLGCRLQCSNWTFSAGPAQSVP